HSGVLCENGIDRGKSLRSDRLADDLRAPQHPPDQLALGGRALVAVDDHELRPGIEEPVCQRHKVPILSRCPVAPPAQDQVEVGSVVAYPAQRPVDEVPRESALLRVDESPDTAAVVATALARTVVVDAGLLDP